MLGILAYTLYAMLGRFAPARLGSARLPHDADLDLIVIGSGIAGLTAALTAAAAGLRVRVLEKEPLFGGTTAFSEAMVWVPCSEAARRAGYTDSAEAAIAYLQAAGAGHTDPSLVEAYVRTAPEALAFLEAHSRVRYELTTGSADYLSELLGATCGIRAHTPQSFDGRLLGKRFRDLRPPLATLMILGGMSISGPELEHFYHVWRSPQSTAVVGRLFLRYLVDRLQGFPRGTVLTGGNGVVAALVLALGERGVPIDTLTAARELLRVDGRVTGVCAERAGKAFELTARRGVVLACGGFPADHGRTARLYPHVAAGKKHYTLAPAANTGDGVALAERAGAAFNDRLQQPAAWAPVSLVPLPSGSVPFPHFSDRCKPGFIAVDRRGRRFVNEATSYHRFVPAMVTACTGDPEVEAFIIADRAAQRRYGLGVAPPFPGRIGPHLHSGYLLAGRTATELAACAGIDPAGLEATIAAYNAHAARGDDPEFGKGTNAYNRANGDPTHLPNPCVAPLVESPFYAVRIVPGDLGTFAGIRTDADARALDAEGRPIEGLYVAGNDMASAMGGAYPGAGISVGSAMTFAYRAARHAAGH